MDKATLEKQLEVSEGAISTLTYVLVQGVAAGGTAESIAKSLQVDPGEVQGIIDSLNETDLLFDKAVALVRVDNFGGVLDRDFGWDDLERVTLKKLDRIIQRVSDPDVLIRIATAANKAKRSTDPAPIPSKSGSVTNNTLILDGGNLGPMRLVLSHRVAEQLSGTGEANSQGSGQKPADDSPKPVGNAGLSMLKLDEIRDLVEESVTPTTGIFEEGKEMAAPGGKKAKIQIDMDSLSNILGLSQVDQDG